VADALPRLSVDDGRLSWQVAESPADTVVDQPSLHTLPDAPRWSPAERALVAANRARIEQLKALPRGVDEPDLGLMLHFIARRAAPDVALSVTGLVLSTAGLVPISLWEAAVATIAGTAAVAARLTRRHQLAGTAGLAGGSQAAEQLWSAHPRFVMDMLVNMLEATLTAATIDDTDLEDELDRFYPRWSRTDFEFDLRRFMA
jgi:hypothetical protein